MNHRIFKQVSDIYVHSLGNLSFGCNEAVRSTRGVVARAILCDARSNVSGWSECTFIRCWEVEERNHRQGSGGWFAPRLSVESRRAAYSRRHEHRLENAEHRSAERGSLLGAVGRLPLVVVRWAVRCDL